MEHFIDTVRRYPCLWNTTAIEYRDQELKDAAWAELMKETDLSSVKEVKLKWKKLRDSYRDALKRQSEMLAREPGAGGGAGKKGYPWKYMGHMHFLQPYMSNRKKPAECAAEAAPPPPNGAASAPSDSDSESADSSPKRKGSERLVDCKQEFPCETQHKRRARAPRPARPSPSVSPRHPAPHPDPLDIFFNGMCQSTKRLPFHAQIEIKKTLFGAVIAAEEALLAQQQSYAGLWAARGRERAASDSSSGSDPAPGHAC